MRLRVSVLKARHEDAVPLPNPTTLTFLSPLHAGPASAHLVDPCSSVPVAMSETPSSDPSASNTPQDAAYDPAAFPAPDLSLILAPITASDWPQIQKLDERCFGPGRFTRTAYRLREGVAPDLDLCRVARVGSFLVGSNIMTRVNLGATPGLLLGPLTVDPAFRSRGIGEALVQASLNIAKDKGHALVLLVGDEPYYSRMGFKRVPPGRLTLPGPVDPARLLICELQDGAFESVHGPVTKAASHV